MNNPTVFIVFRFSVIAIELAVYILLFIVTMKKRQYWIPKLIIVLLLVIGITIGLSFATGALYSSFNYDHNLIPLFGALLQLIILFLLGAGFYFCFDVSLYQLGSVVSLGYALRWVIFSIYSLVLNFVNPDLILFRIGQQNIVNTAIYLAFYLPFTVISALLIRKYKNEQHTLELPAFIAIFAVILLNTFLISFAETSSSEHLLEYSFVLISNIINLSLIIAINFFTQRQMKLRLEKDVFSSMLVKQTEQYKFNKANAEMLHVKAHDLKHQVMILRKGGQEAEDLLNELESVVYGYESTIITDNPVLNIIISEKWQYCVKHKIKMTCNVDPKAFNNVEPIHLYSLLGNILDNAIDAVMQIKDKNKRIISLNITYNHGVSLLHCYNYFNGEVEIKDGIPVTTKEEKNIHGFGVKSIKSIVSQYSGEVSFDVDKDVFNLHITMLS